MFRLVNMQHSLSPEIGVHGVPVDNFSRSGSGGVNLSKLSVGMDLNEPASSKWSSTTSIKFEVWFNLIIMHNYTFINNILAFFFLRVFICDFHYVLKLDFKLLSYSLQHVRPMSDDGRFISRDMDGFPVTCR